MEILDILILGSGPAALCLASELAKQKLNIKGISTKYPNEKWENTYGIWASELEELGLESLLSHRWSKTVSFFGNGENKKGDNPTKHNYDYGLINQEAFGMHGEEVDGMDVLAVRGAAQRAIERARAGEGPTLLECLTYRYRGHSLADPDELRSEKEKEFWGKRDPIKKLAQEIIDGKFATEEELKIIEKKIDAEISESVKNAIEAPEPPSEELTKYIWAED